MEDRRITDFRQRCSVLKSGFTKQKQILDGQPDLQFETEEYSSIYTSVYNMCSQPPPHDYSQELYDWYREAIEEYCKETVLPSLREKHGEHLLTDLALRWSNHKALMKWLSRFFYYIDHYFVARRPLPSLREVGITCFRDLVFHEIKSKAKNVVIALIHKEREGEQIDKGLLKNVLDIYVEIGMGMMEIYEEYFESFMLQDTALYYSQKASSWIKENSFPIYMLKSEQCLTKEIERVTDYLHLSTEPKLVEKVEHELLVVSANQLLGNDDSGCRALLRDDKMEDLSRMYKLYRNIPQVLQLIADIFSRHVTAEGNLLIEQAEDAATNQMLISKIIELHDKHLANVSKIFQEDTLFHKAFDQAFRIFCNKSVSKTSSPELLAAFCDRILKKAESENVDIENTLEKVVKLLEYISDKDCFAEFARRKLARRLLLDSSGNDEYEISFLTKLKGKFGGTFTSAMEGMVKDMQISREYKDLIFNNHLSTTANLGTKLTVSVLSKNHWPSYKTPELKLPSDMVKCVEAFEAFYHSKFNKKKKLSWIYSLGTCHVVGNFDGKQINLIVSPCQAAVLLLFNDREKLNYAEILDQLNLSTEDGSSLLQSLSCGDYKILKKEPMLGAISKTDTFEFNSKFTWAKQKVKIPHLLRKDKEEKVVLEAVKNDRKFVIDAAITRIMKSSKVLGYQQLLAECTEHLSGRFKPDMKMIKLQIEDLILRGFLEKDKLELKYVA